MELEELYDAVPAAQEEDLLDELVRDRQRAAQAEWLAAVEQGTHRRVAEPAEPLHTDAPAEPEPPLTPGQVLGLVEHQLGAVVLPQEEKAAGPEDEFHDGAEPADDY